jgi:hypothetical protein
MDCVRTESVHTPLSEDTRRLDLSRDEMRREDFSGVDETLRCDFKDVLRSEKDFHSDASRSDFFRSEAFRWLKKSPKLTTLLDCSVGDISGGPNDRPRLMLGDATIEGIFLRNDSYKPPALPKLLTFSGSSTYQLGISVQ